MGFDDLARHMKARDGGTMSTSTDPNLMMVEASERAQAQQLLRDLVLGPMLLIGGALVMVLWFRVDRSRLDASMRAWSWLLMASVVGGMASGARRLKRALQPERKRRLSES
jgi:hypothetical protein